MKVYIRRLFNKTNIETGAVITAIVGKPTTSQEKEKIEESLKQYAFNTLYPEEGLSIYSNIYTDSPSITVIKNINELANDETINI